MVIPRGRCAQESKIEEIGLFDVTCGYLEFAVSYVYNSTFCVEEPEIVCRLAGKGGPSLHVLLILRAVDLLDKRSLQPFFFRGRRRNPGSFACAAAEIQPPPGQ
jgi:hypothetical protein